MTSLLLPHISSSLTDSLPSSNLLCHSKPDARFMQDDRKAIWSIPYVSVAVFPSLKQNFIAYCSSKVADGIFEIHQLWQSGFNSMYSNCCCSCSFEPEIIKIDQSSHKMYSNNILNFTTILKAHTKKVWKLIVCTSYIYIYIWKEREREEEDDEREGERERKRRERKIEREGKKGRGEDRIKNKFINTTVNIHASTNLLPTIYKNMQIHTHLYIYIYIYIYKLAILVDGNPKASFSIATTPRRRGGCYSFSKIAPLYPWSVPYNPEYYAMWYQVPFFESLVWLYVGLNLGHWQTLYSLSQYTYWSLCEEE